MIMHLFTSNCYIVVLEPKKLQKNYYFLSLHCVVVYHTSTVLCTYPVTL